MIITTVGSSNSGKSTFCLKLAKEFAMTKKNVIVVFADSYTPGFVTFFPEAEEVGSLGKLLSQPILTQEIIERECNTVKGEDFLAFLGYRKKENKFYYANYTKEQAEDLIIQLKHMADVVIIDASYNFYDDIFTNVALQMAERSFFFVRADLKGLSFYKSNAALIEERAKETVKVISDVDGSMLGQEVAEEIGGTTFLLPYVEECKTQFLEENILSAMGKKGKGYEAIIKKIRVSIE